ncbi:MaoC family dehydratase [Polaribacter haliotis]|uniref:MaoC family dehydratase n=1 Tax=Polaribacter haliotis TaxID=1888915 RepID=A0A7L8AHQ2_9FLAO|nr:MaoC family dehydratase [Polaribacter haliotis]QOD61528.1 MaoC family dehydratase [Polaribacter haliotis]
MKITIGDTASISKTITEKDIQLFSEISLDINPIHLDKEYASSSRFKKRIVHGFLVGSYISAVLGTKLPGYGSIYLKQTMSFIKPVYYDETITAKVTVKEVDIKKARIILITNCFNQNNELVLEGEAYMKVDKTILF